MFLHVYIINALGVLNSWFRNTSVVYRKAKLNKILLCQWYWWNDHFYYLIILWWIDRGPKFIHYKIWIIILRKKIKRIIGSFMSICLLWQSPHVSLRKKKIRHRSKAKYSNVQRKIYYINKCVLKRLQLGIAKLMYNL